MNNIESLPLTKARVYPFWLWLFFYGGLISAAFFAYIPDNFVHFQPLQRLVFFTGRFVPSINLISSRSIDFYRYSLVLASQWFLTPIYALVLLVKFFPKSTNVKITTIKYFSHHRRPNRFWLAVGLIALFVELAACVGLISWPSIYNGGYVIDADSPISSIFYKSKLFLIIYAWASGILDVLCVWLIFAIILNWRIMFGVSDSEKVQIP